MTVEPDVVERQGLPGVTMDGLTLCRRVGWTCHLSRRQGLGEEPV